MHGSRIIYKPIGLIFSPFKEIEGIPVQPAAVEGISGKIKVYSKYAEGLAGLDGFSHIIIIYHIHLSEGGYSLRVVPFLQDTEQGIFATRAPKRPNHTGFSVVKIDKIEGNIINVSNIDVVDGTPLLDIKPYVNIFDNVKDEKTGWLSEKIRKVSNTKSDDRFE